MRSPSLDFALRASLRLSQFAPGELVFAPSKKSKQKKDGPEGLPAARVPCASRDFKRSPDSQDLLRHSGWQIQLDTVARFISKSLCCSAVPTVCGVPP